ncbi:lipase member K isoform X2 [Folsomia candida]|uniref:lipase member K isoform X2 n=1 Tax=Folsomia candida TaxID=158441 RepID=UPI00160546D6|nr:lipase member K isoform X2 [Folsomia candida]
MFGFLVVLILTQFFKSAQPSVISNLIRMENLDPGRDQDYGNLPPNLSTIELITRRGYPVHKHDIVTKDGYILTAFRIPHGKSWASHGYPVYIMHGGAMSSSDWLVNLSEDNCLPFLLANQGYDVWLGNLRGNMYSNRHINLTHNDPLFWNYGMDEVAKYDIPDAIDYILEKSKRRKLHFLGYSIGNTPFYMTMASRPEYNEKIGIHVSYAASVFFSTFPVSNRINALITTRPLSILQKLIGGFPVPPEGITFMSGAN